MGSYQRLRRAHKDRANCMNARCMAWMPISKFPLCPSCRLMLYTGVGLGKALLLTAGALWWLLQVLGGS